MKAVTCPLCGKNLSTLYGSSFMHCGELHRVEDNLAKAEASETAYEAPAAPMTSTQEPELKPCPFCGSFTVRKISLDDGVERVWCENCHAQGPNGYLTINGNHDWNTRVDNSQALVAAAYEAAALNIFKSRHPAFKEYWCCSGFDVYGQVGCGCYGITVGEEKSEQIRALTPTNAQDALSTLIAAAEKRRK